MKIAAEAAMSALSFQEIEVKNDPHARVVCGPFDRVVFSPETHPTTRFPFKLHTLRGLQGVNKVEEKHIVWGNFSAAISRSNSDQFFRYAIHELRAWLHESAASLLGEGDTVWITIGGDWIDGYTRVPGFADYKPSRIERPREPR